MESDKPDNVLAVLHVVVGNIPNKAAYGYKDSSGQRVVCADRTLADGDPIARESAFQAFIVQYNGAIEDQDGLDL